MQSTPKTGTRTEQEHPPDEMEKVSDTILKRRLPAYDGDGRVTDAIKGILKITQAEAKQLSHQFSVTKLALKENETKIKQVTKFSEARTRIDIPPDKEFSSKLENSFLKEISAILGDQRGSLFAISVKNIQAISLSNFGDSLKQIFIYTGPSKVSIDYEIRVTGNPTFLRKYEAVPKELEHLFSLE